MGRPQGWIVSVVAAWIASATMGCSGCANDMPPGDHDGSMLDGSTEASVHDAGSDARVDAGDTGIHIDGSMDTGPVDSSMMTGDTNDDASNDAGMDTGPHDTGVMCTTDSDCEDGFSCTIDQCSVGGTCTRTISTTACADDGLFCNGGMACSPSASTADPTTGCAPTPAPVCDDGLTCTTDSCDEGSHACVNTPDSTVCDDSTFCNGAERCAPGTGADARGCVSGTPPVCNDGFDCTMDTCSSTTDACTFTPFNSACSDGLVCDGIETCSPTTAGADARGCLPGMMPNCDDGAACTSDSCSEGAGGCTHTADDTLCADGLFCDGVELCAPGAGADTRGCVAGTPIGCAGDGIACTIDSCDEATMSCISTPSSALCSPTEVCDPSMGGCVTGRACPGGTNAECDDGNVCNGAETCVANICRAGTNLTCGDAFACTTDSCDPVAGCQHVANDSVCDDHLVCDGIETCSLTAGCQAGTAPICNDSISCTADSCSESAGGCIFVPDSTVCSDGSFCDGAEVCTPGIGCQAGPAPTCNDGIACTMDACSTSLNACTHTAVDSICNNGQYCDGVETCNATTGCVPGTPINCNDGLACSDDTCIEATDSCNHNFNSANCGSGMVCTVSGCVTGTSCTGPTASICDDGQYCNGLETCSSSTSTPGTCQPGTPVDCNDGQACTTDLCSNFIAACTYTAWDRDGDGFPDASCLGLGNDCNDLNASIHPGAPETCNNVDSNCDGVVDNGLTPTGGSCTTPSMCCTGACASGICTLPSTTCERTLTICTMDSDCCSGRCSLEVDGQHHCTLIGGCHIAGEACTTAADCCSTGCVGGVCSDTVTCHVTGAACTGNAQCCSNICTGGTCRTAGSGCQVDGEICSSNGNCCSGYCLGGHCSTHDYCRAGGEICTTNAQCCDGGCDAATHRCELLGSCSIAGQPCTGVRDCCSALCTDSTGSGITTCQFLDGCRPFGEVCTSDSLCCSHQCGTPDADGVRRCVDPPGCLDPGEICHGGGSSDCCVLKSVGCIPTGLGVSRCNDTTTCIADGGLCEFDAQCCNGERCLLQPDGSLRCGATCVADGFACLSNSDCCDGSCILGFCQPASSGCTATGQPCGASSECCSLNCDSICFP